MKQKDSKQLEIIITNEQLFQTMKLKLQIIYVLQDNLCNVQQIVINKIKFGQSIRNRQLMEVDVAGQKGDGGLEVVGDQQRRLEKEQFGNDQKKDFNKQQIMHGYKIGYCVNKRLKGTFFARNIASQGFDILNGDSPPSYRQSVKQGQQIFGVPKAVVNLYKLQISRKKQSSDSSKCRLFSQQEDFLNQLKERVRIKSSRNFNVSLITEIENSHRLSGDGYKEKVKTLRGFGGFELTGFEGNNRSKTLEMERSSDNKGQAFSLKREKNLSYRKKRLFKQKKAQNINKFYEKFESFCKRTANYPKDQLHKNEFRPIFFSFKQKKDSFKSKEALQYCDRTNSGINKDKIHELDATDVQKEQPHNSKLRLMGKSSSNMFDLGKKGSSTKRQQKSNQILQGNKQQEKILFSYKGERIHNVQRDCGSLLLRNESNASGKKRSSRYRHHDEKSMKVGNNTHVLVTENNRTKINIFHNSVLLREDPQRVEVLAAVVGKREETNRVRGPFELEINKLKIQQKGSPREMMGVKREINRRIEEMVKGLRGKRRSSEREVDTQRGFGLRVEDMQPWGIKEQGSIQESREFFLI